MSILPRKKGKSAERLATEARIAAHNQRLRDETIAARRRKKPRPIEAPAPPPAPPDGSSDGVVQW